MALSLKHREEFRSWAKKHFKEHRELTTAELFKIMQSENPALAKKINKAARKAQPTTYIGRYLLRSFTSQGWLIHDGEKWITQPAEDYCTYCFKPLDADIYLLDIDLNYYCDDDCFLDAGAGEAYDGYWDQYMNLFYEYDKLRPLSRSTSQSVEKPEPLDHLEVIKLAENLEHLIYDPDYNDIWYNGGDDGPFAAEMYRMLTVLQEDLDHIKEVQENMKALRISQKEYYTLTLPPNLPKTKKMRSKVENFIKNQEKYCHKERPNTWCTEDYSRFNKWKDKFKTLDITFHNTLKCPICCNEGDFLAFRLAADNFKYCEECFERYDLKRYNPDEERGYLW